MRSLAGRPCPRSPSRMQTELEAARLRERLSGFAGRRVLAIGDVMLDQFIWGKVSRISPEAPVPVVEVTGETYRLGGAGNVVANICALGGRAIPIGVIGKDSASHRVMDLMQDQGLETAALVRTDRQ